MNFGAKAGHTKLRGKERGWSNTVVVCHRRGTELLLVPMRRRGSGPSAASRDQLRGR